MNVSSVCPGISELIGPRLFVNANDDCVICQEQLILKAGKDYGATGPPYVIECGHAFHEECLRRALERSRQCPTCRQPTRALQREDVARRRAEAIRRRERERERERDARANERARLARLDARLETVQADGLSERNVRAAAGQRWLRERPSQPRRGREYIDYTDAAVRRWRAQLAQRDVRENEVRAAASARWLRENSGQGFGSQAYGDYIEDAVRRWRAQATEENEI